MFTEFISLIMHDESEKNSDSAVIVHTDRLAQPQLSTEKSKMSMVNGWDEMQKLL